MGYLNTREAGNKSVQIAERVIAADGKRGSLRLDAFDEVVAVLRDEYERCGGWSENRGATMRLSLTFQKDPKVFPYDTHVVAAFPGTGKTYFTQYAGWHAKDSDSSSFSKLSDGTRNPDFPANYIAHIREQIGTCAVIFVSSHKEVREALVAAGITFTLAYPAKCCKEEYLARYRQRNSPPAFISLIAGNWDAWLTELETQTGCHHLVLQSGEYLESRL